MSDSLWHIPEEGERRKENVQGHQLFHTLLHRGVELEPLVLADRFEVRHVLGQGGTGLVVKATDRLRQRDIALKIMNPEWMRISEGVESFRKEARVAARLKHDHILRVFDVFETCGLKMLSMELLHGVHLREHVIQAGNDVFRDPVQTHHVLRPLFEALIYAHRHTVHRDIKPENIGIESGGVVKLMDFGIASIQDQETSLLARTSMTQIHAGTPFYAAPEQLYDSKTIGPSVDQYSLGVVAYEMLTGTPPMGVASPMEMLRPELPVSLTRAFDRALSRKPEDRFPDVEAFAEQVERGMRTQRAPLKRAITSRQGRRQLRTIITMALLVALTLVVSIFFRIRLDQRAVRLDEVWGDIKKMELSLAHVEQAWNEQLRMVNIVSNDFQNALTRAELGLIPPSSWMEVSNRLHLQLLVMEGLREQGVHPDQLKNDREQLRHLRRVLLAGDVGQVESLIKRTGETMTSKQNLLKSEPETILSELKLHNLQQGLRWMHQEGLLMGDGGENSLPPNEVFDLDPVLLLKEENTKWHAMARQSLSTLEDRVSMARQHWMDLSHQLDPEALSFIFNVPELMQQARYLRSIGDVKGAAQRFQRSLETLTQWNMDLQTSLDRSEETWRQRSDTIENAVGMCFVHIGGSAYASIWETRVMDFARFVHEKGAGYLTVEDRWQKPGYPLSPVSPVSSLTLSEIMHFCGWLTHKFPDHEVEVNLPGELGAENHTAFAKLYRKQSVPKAILVDPDAYDNPWFKEDYQDNAVKSGDWVQHVGMSPTDATGIFDLHGNVWEWTNDVYEDERGSPSNHRLLPVLVGGGPGSVTFQNYEPADSNLQTVLRPELIGFRVIVSAFPKGSSSLKRDSKLDK